MAQSEKTDRLLSEFQRWLIIETGPLKMTDEEFKELLLAIINDCEGKLEDL